MAKLRIKRPSGDVTSIRRSESIGYGRLGRELRISPKSMVYINKEGFKVEFFVPTVEILIGIGDNHTATLVMDKGAWEAFKSGESLNVTTLRQFVANIY